MGQLLVTTDDLDGTHGAEPIPFSLMNAPFEIDLVEANLEKFIEAMAPFISRARYVGRTEPVVPDEVRRLMVEGDVRTSPPMKAITGPVVKEDPDAKPALVGSPVFTHVKGQAVADRGESGRKHTAQELKTLRAWCEEHGVDPKRIAMGPIANRFWEAWSQQDPSLLQLRDLLPGRRRRIKAAATS